MVGLPPADWRAQFFTAQELNDPAVSGAFADADGDRLLNALEYLLGSDLRDINSQPVAEVSSVEEGGSRFAEFRFTLREGVTEFGARIQQSLDLQVWSDASSFFTLQSSTPNGDGTRTVTYRANNAIAPDTRLFLRVLAVETP